MAMEVPSRVIAMVSSSSSTADVCVCAGLSALQPVVLHRGRGTSRAVPPGGDLSRPGSRPTSRRLCETTHPLSLAVNADLSHVACPDPLNCGADECHVANWFLCSRGPRSSIVRQQSRRSRSRSAGNATTWQSPWLATLCRDGRFSEATCRRSRSRSAAIAATWQCRRSRSRSAGIAAMWQSPWLATLCRDCRIAATSRAEGPSIAPIESIMRSSRKQQCHVEAAGSATWQTGVRNRSRSPSSNAVSRGSISECCHVALRGNGEPRTAVGSSRGKMTRGVSRSGYKWEEAVEPRGRWRNRNRSTCQFRVREDTETEGGASSSLDRDLGGERATWLGPPLGESHCDTWRARAIPGVNAADVALTSEFSAAVSAAADDDDRTGGEHAKSFLLSENVRMIDWLEKQRDDDVATSWHATSAESRQPIAVKGVEVGVAVRLHGKLIRQRRLQQCLEMLESLLEDEGGRGVLINALLPCHRDFLDSCSVPEHLDLAFAYVDLFPEYATWLSAPLIATCGRVQRVDKIESVLDRQRQLGVMPDECAYVEAVLGAAKSGKMRKAMEFFQRAQRDGVCDTACWNALIEAYSLRGNSKQAVFSVYEKMKLCSSAPNFTTFLLLLKAARGPGNVAQADTVYKEMKSRGFKPTAHVFTLLFGVAKAAVDKGPRNKALHEIGLTTWAWHEDMEIVGIAHNVFTLSALMSVVGRIGSMWKVAYDSFYESRFCDDNDANVSAYSAMIHLCAQAGMVDQALELQRELKDAGAEPMSFALAAVIAACKKGSRIDRAFEVYRELLKDHNYATLTGSGPDQPPGITIIRNSLVNLCKECMQMDRAFEIFEEMKNDKRNPPDGVTYSTLITACGQAQQVDRAFSLLEEMRSRGITPSGPVFTALMTACVKAQKPADAFTVYAEMKAARKTPTQVTFGCLLNACLELSDVQRAFEVYEEMLKMGVQPNDGCHNILIRLCSKAGKVDQALERVKQLLYNKGNITVETFNSVLRALCQTHTDRAVRFFSLMRTMNIPRDQGSFLALVQSCARDNQALKGYNFFLEMDSRGMPPESHACSELISSLCRAGEMQCAFKVREKMISAGVNAQQFALCDLISMCSRGGRHQKALELYDEFKRQAAMPPGSLYSEAGLPLAGKNGNTQSTRTSPKTTGTFFPYSPSAPPHMTVMTSTACEALIEACCLRGQIEKGMAVFQDALEAGVHLNTATLAYLANVCSREKSGVSFHIYAVTAQLRKELARRKTLEIDMESEQAAEYKQAHFRSGRGSHDGDGEEFEWSEEEDEEEEEEQEEEEEEEEEDRTEEEWREQTEGRKGSSNRSRNVEGGGRNEGGGKPEHDDSQKPGHSFQDVSREEQSSNSQRERVRRRRRSERSGED